MILFLEKSVINVNDKDLAETESTDYELRWKVSAYRL